MGMGMMDKLCLSGALAKQLKGAKVGETVKLTVTAVLKSSMMMNPDSVESGKAPYLEFNVIEVDGGKKPYAEMSASEMESEMSDVYHNDQDEPLPKGMPNREDGGSIWLDMKEQEKVNQKPFTRHRPFAFR